VFVEAGRWLGEINGRAAAFRISLTRRRWPDAGRQGLVPAGRARCDWRM